MWSLLENPQKLSDYSVSDALSTYYIYKLMIHDFIFALIAEELGLVFTILIVVLFYIIFLRIFKLARKCMENKLYFASNLSFMIGLLITIQAIIHIMVNIGMLPTKGMGLPFISYGGTNLLVMFICIGLLFRIQIENRQKISQGVQRGY